MADRTIETRDTSENEPEVVGPPIAGAVLVFSVDHPTLVTTELRERTTFGRGAFGGALDDARASRDHVSVTPRDGGLFFVEDVESRNGTFVDGTRLARNATVPSGSVVRIGQSLFLLTNDVRSFALREPVERDFGIVGPALSRAHAAIARAARAGDHALFIGESGSGKELAARVFHEASARTGPLVAVNCAAIPTGVAERLLFGAKRGAYSGADADADGYFAAADRGTLFLDEMAELDLLVQAKLLRAIETQEIFPVGASRSKRVDVRICAATHKDLRHEINRGTFRQDLYFRVGRPEIALPPLRERREEIPWLLAREIARAAPGVPAHVAFVEACLLRPWPGNVRELMAEARHAARESLARGSDAVKAIDLAARAGEHVMASGDGAGVRHEPNAASAAGAVTPLVVRRRTAGPEDEEIRRALQAHSGNVTAAARALGMHRTQLRRWIERQTDGQS